MIIFAIMGDLIVDEKYHMSNVNSTGQCCVVERWTLFVYFTYSGIEHHPKLVLYQNLVYYTPPWQYVKRSKRFDLWVK